MAGAISNVITLRGLEVFDELARSGSLQDTARKLGLSPPAASQQLKNLETALGISLIEHSRRPLEPTRAGRAYLSHVHAALAHLRQGATELSLMDLQRLRSLRLGIIDDFDGEVTPRLAVKLAGMLGPCELSLLTAPSHVILDDIVQHRIDLGIAGRPHDLPEGVTETPLLRDPFVLALPHGYLPGPPKSIAALGDLPLLRYDKTQIMGRQVATHLARLKLAPPGRIVLDSNQALFGLVASGAGWAISTPLGYLRARRFHGQVDLFPLPFAGFSRIISLFHLSDWTDEISETIGGSLREILRAQVIDPGLAAMPWTEGSLALLPDA
jgi:DNA-binding transcriptional LysR family regulator